MQKVTSAEAAKLLKKLDEELSSVKNKEQQGKDFLAALGEDPESVRPKYDYGETDKKITELEGKIRNLKHAINVFNTTTVVPETNLTIDQMLVYIPQLTKRCTKLWDMMNKLPKTRENACGYGKNPGVIDYRYVNYDLEEAERDYYKYKKELDFAQLQLDYANTTLEFLIDDSLF